MGSYLAIGTGKSRLVGALQFVLSALTFVLQVAPVEAGGGPRDVAVVINAGSTVSREIGRYYQAARGVPERNICWISCPTQEIVSEAVCESQIRAPIRSFLNKPEIAGKIDYIVLTKGVPLAADYGDPTGPYSITSILTCVDHPEMTGPIASPYGPQAVNTWGAYAPETAWSHSLSFGSGYHFYLVTRLDGFNLDQVKSIIDRSSMPFTKGSFALDRNNLLYGAYKTANLRLGDQAGSAYDVLIHRGFPVQYDGGTDFLNSLVDLMGYFSWSGHDEKYTFAKYTSNSFLPGSIADSYYSSSGRTFNDPGTTNRAPLIADLFNQGVCAVGGYVSEPYITTATYPTILFDRYTKGYNVAESFYAACTHLFWKTTIAGDPLMAPFATRPEVSVQLADTRLCGVETISADAADSSGISKVAFYIDDDLIGVDTEAPYEVSLDTTNYPIGPHTLEAIAYQAGPVGSQGSAKAAVVIDNPVSAIPSIHDLLAYPDGQIVRLQSKVVTAGTDELGDSFYIEEQDRSSAVRVLSTAEVTRGQVVTVIGSTATVSGDRVLANASVTVLAPDGAVPPPLLVKLSDLGGVGIGEFTPAVGVRGGARNVALLVRCVGRVAGQAPGGGFYICDGAEMVRVAVPAGVTIPAQGMVAVTGLCVPEEGPAGFRAAIRARCAADIEIM